jgi:MFS family permease
MPPTPSPRPRFFGWTVVAGAFLLAMSGWGLGFYGPPVFLHTIHATRGWPIGLISTAVTIHYLVGAATVANLPAIYGRFGVPLATKAGSLALVAGLLGWALATSPWQLFLAAALSGTGWITLGAAAVNAIVSPWFVRTRPAALAMAYNGASVGGVVFSPLWVFAIGWLGFAAAVAVVGAIIVAMLWVLSDRVFSATPESLGQSPDGDAPGAPSTSLTSPLARPLPGALIWRDTAFLTLTVGTSLALFAQVGLIAHLFSLLVPALGAQWAGIAMATATVAAVTGRSLVGWLMPAGADRRFVASISYAIQIAGCLALIAAGGTSPVFIWIGVLLFGLGIGNLVSLPPLIAQVEFVREDVPRAVALMVAAGQAFYAFSPAAYGLVREATPAGWQGAPGDAPLVFGVTAAFFALAIITYLSGRRR